MLIGVEHRLTLPGLQRHRQDLAGKPALFDRVRRPLVRQQREFILLAASHLMRLSEIFRGHAHMDVVKRVVQRGGHHVDHRAVAHSGTPAYSRRQIPCTAHAFRPAGNRNVGIAQCHRLGGRHDRLQTRTAEAVQRQRRCILGNSGVHRRDAGQVHVLRLGVNHVAEYHVLDLIARDMGARQCLPSNLAAEFGGWNVL